MEDLVNTTNQTFLEPANDFDVLLTDVEVSEMSVSKKPANLIKTKATGILSCIRGVLIMIMHADYIMPEQFFLAACVAINSKTLTKVLFLYLRMFIKVNTSISCSCW